MNYTRNFLLHADSYKASHFRQYPPGIQHVSSYIESRGGAYPVTLFFGLQMFLQAYLSQPITLAMIDEAEELLTGHGLPFCREGWLHILYRHGGHLPVSVEAVPEGNLLPTHNILAQIVNTDPACYWLTSYLETALLRAIWYPTTVATRSHTIKQIIAAYLHETADSSDGLLFKLHDFGARGVSSHESAVISGLAHLVNFRGSDTLEAIRAARHYYAEPMAGFSIPAAEHSTITSWGKDGELAAYRNMLTQFGGPGKIVAVVSDSYDLWHAIDALWGSELKVQVKNHGGTLVIRPDSGDPVEVVTAVVERLMANFGHDINSKGYRILPPYLRVIQGDGINEHSIAAILANLKQHGLSADNVAFGMGGALLQQINRDTLKFAMKASAAQVSGEWHDVYKDPATDTGKASKRGRLALIAEPGWQTVRVEELAGRQNRLVPVYRDGELLQSWTLAEIRKRSEQTMPA